MRRSSSSTLVREGRNKDGRIINAIERDGDSNGASSRAVGGGDSVMARLIEPRPLPVAVLTRTQKIFAAMINSSIRSRLTWGQAMIAVIAADGAPPPQRSTNNLHRE